MKVILADGGYRFEFENDNVFNGLVDLMYGISDVIEHMNLDFEENKTRFDAMKYKMKPTKPPTVEISLEDASLILNNLYGWKSYLRERGCIGAIPNQTIATLEQAISKAEGKDTLADCLKRDDDNFRESLKSASPVNNQMKGTINLHLTPTAQAELAKIATIQEPDTAIQDQVNELRKDILQFKCDVVKDIKIFEWNVSEVVKEISSLKDTISQLQRVIEGMKGKSV